MEIIRLISALNEKFGFADGDFVCAAVNSLEKRIREEILAPAGIIHRKTPLDPDKDMHTALLLEDDCFNLYFYYTAALISAEQCDSERANIYKDLFNQMYRETAVAFRRKYCPVSDLKIGGRGI